MKRRQLMSSVALPFFSLDPFAAVAADSTFDTRPAELPTKVSALLQQSERDIDVATTALNLAAEVYSGLPTSRYLERLAAMVNEASSKLALAGVRSHRDIVRGLNSYLFDDFGMQYDHSPDGKGKTETYFLNGIMDTKRGMCLTMPMLYLAISQRLGLPISVALAPQHTFLRYQVPGRTPHNIEVTSGGGTLTDEAHVRKFSIPSRAIENGAYLRTLSMREYMATMLLPIGHAMHDRGKPGLALAYFESAHRLNPKSPIYVRVLAAFWMNAAKKAHEGNAPVIARKLYERSMAHRKQAEAMGWPVTDKT